MANRKRRWGQALVGAGQELGGLFGLMQKQKLQQQNAQAAASLDAYLEELRQKLTGQREAISALASDPSKYGTLSQAYPNLPTPTQDTAVSSILSKMEGVKGEAELPTDESMVGMMKGMGQQNQVTNILPGLYGPVPGLGNEGLDQLRKARTAKVGQFKTAADEAVKTKGKEAEATAYGTGVGTERATSENFPAAVGRKVEEEAQVGAAKNKNEVALQRDLNPVLVSRAGGEEAARQRARASAEAEIAKAGLPKELVGPAIQMASQFNELSKNYTQREESFRTITQLMKSPSPLGDTSLIFAYMKMVDPASTVREGEQATVQNARGVPEQLRALYNQATSGYRLTPAQRQDVASQAANIYKGAYQSHQQTIKDYTQRAVTMSIPPHLIVRQVDPALLGGAGEKPPVQPPQAGKGLGGTNITVPSKQKFTIVSVQ